MSTVVQAPEIRRAMSVSARVDEVSDEVREQKADELCISLQSLVYDCVALSSQWRALVEYVTSAECCGKEIDYRMLRDILLPPSIRTATLYVDVKDMVDVADCSIADDPLADLEIAIVESGDVVRWIESWPMNDDARRKEARASIARGEFSESADLMADEAD